MRTDLAIQSGRAGFAWVLLCCAAALGLTSLELPDLQRTAVLVLVVPILVGAYVGGARAALLATVLVGIGSALMPAGVHGAPWLALWAVGFLITTLAWWGRRDEARAIRSERAALEEAANARFAEQARQAQLFRFMAERSAVPFYITDPDDGMRLTYVNEAAVKHFGYPMQQLLTMRVAEFDVRVQAGQQQTPPPELLEKGSLLIESEHRVAGGRVVPVEVSLNYFSYSGRALIAGWFRDISLRKQAEESLKASEDALRNVFNVIDDAIVVHDLDGRIMDANSPFLSMFSLDAEKAVGTNLMDFCRAPAGAEEPRVVWSRAMGGDAQLVDWQGVRKGDDEGAELQVFVRRARWSGRDALVSKIRDTTLSRRAERDLREREAGLRLLSETAARLLREEDTEQTLRELFDAVAQRVDAAVYFNYLVSDDGTHLDLHSSRGVDEQTARKASRLDFGQALCGTVAERRERMVLCRLQDCRDPVVDVVRSLGVRAYACHPLIAEGLLGTISFGATNRDSFSDSELELMRAVADQVSMALARHRLNRELAHRARDLDEANQAKDHFLAVLSHELRTPLTPVLASAELLLSDPSLPERLRTDLEMVVRNTDLEARLIDDLLDITRIARGKIELYRHRIELRNVLERAIEVCRPDIQARSLQLEVSICRQKPYIVHADPARLQQVFWNLIKNAVKFTPPGGRISIRCVEQDKQVAVTVADTGEGIDPAVLPHIFVPFEQAGKTRQFGGLGLGLSISKSLVELHGGTIQAQSQGKGKGAQFTVALPLLTDAAGEQGAVPHGGGGQESKARHLNVLLVEDHGDTATIMKRVLTNEGHSVQVAADVATGTRLALEGAFDLLISDLGLPDGSGTDIIRSIRQHGLQMPAVALSGFGQDEDIRRSYDAGFTTHLTKPVDVARLREVIRVVTT